MDLHHFDGKNLSVWMFQLQQNFLYYNTPNDLHKYMMASYHMEGEALTWLETMERSGVFTMDADWEKFVRLIHLRFGQESVPEKEKHLENVKEGEEEKRDGEATDLVEAPYHLFDEISGEALPEATKEHTDEEILKKFNAEDDELRDNEATSTFIPKPDPTEATDHTKIPAIVSSEDAYPLFDVTPPRIFDILEVQQFPVRRGLDYQIPDRYAEYLFDENSVNSGNGKHNPRRDEILDWVAPQQHGGYAVPMKNILEASIHTVNPFLSQYLNENRVDFEVLKHRWRWKRVADEEDAEAVEEVPQALFRGASFYSLWRAGVGGVRGGHRRRTTQSRGRATFDEEST
jgi:hypothetical protein